MNSGKLVFAQLMEHLPLHTFRRCVQRYPSKYPTKTFSHLDQFLCMAQRFYGTTENAVKTQIWIAISVYVLVAIVKKRLNTEASLYTILQILSLTLFEKTPIDQLVKNTEVLMDTPESYNKLNLFN
ncbi:MAG: DUF4372 domain-containing protein [Nitrosomonas sp.]|nr:DUF4372 domain-containing protein [Nitrosomonas sp.]